LHPQNTPTSARILLVEDDDVARESLDRVLRRASHHVEAVPDGETACERLGEAGQQAGYDIVLTDLLLREVDGLAVLRQCRQLADPPEVILLTGYGTLQTALEALRVGAFDYLLKPCKPDDLLRRVDEAYRRRVERRSQQEAIASIAFGLSRLQRPEEGAQAPQGPPSTQVGSLRIDRQKHTVFLRGAELVLTPTEFAILRCLADNAGQMVPYSELARQVYRQLVSDSEAHTMLKTHIHNLRHKIGPELIVNVRSVGYRLVAPE
jgi:DNA-binding response OmpR family regulator